MTYCVGLCLEDGLVMLADTRTNAGVDNISTFSKLHVLSIPGERVIVAMTAGNLAITQAVMNLVLEGPNGLDDQPSEAVGKSHPTLHTVPSMFAGAELVGQAVRAVYERDAAALKAQDIGFDVSILLAGQIKGRRVRLFNIYAAGNFVEATADTPYLQVGEHKYGKPILDRVLRYDTPLAEGVKLVLVSMDSTLRSNLTVGMPIDLLVYRKDKFEVAVQRRFDESDPYFQQIRRQWSEALRAAYQAIPTLEDI